MRLHQRLLIRTMLCLSIYALMAVMNNNLAPYSCHSRFYHEYSSSVYEALQACGASTALESNLQYIDRRSYILVGRCNAGVSIGFSAANGLEKKHNEMYMSLEIQFGVCSLSTRKCFSFFPRQIKFLFVASSSMCISLLPSLVQIRSTTLTLIFLPQVRRCSILMTNL